MFRTRLRHDLHRSAFLAASDLARAAFTLALAATDCATLVSAAICATANQQPRIKMVNSSSGGPPSERPPTITKERAPYLPWRTKTRCPLDTPFVWDE